MIILILLNSEINRTKAEIIQTKIRNVIIKNIEKYLLIYLNIHFEKE